MSVDTYTPPQVVPESLVLLTRVANFYDNHAVNINDYLGGDPAIPSFAKSALFSWVDEQRGTHVLYDLRLASSVGDLRIAGFGAQLGDYVGYELKDDDAFVLFMKDGLGGWISRYTVVLDFDGNVPYSREYYHGPLPSGGGIGDGEAVRPCSDGIGRAILRNMMQNAKPVKQRNLRRSKTVQLKQFVPEMRQHTIGT